MEKTKQLPDVSRWRSRANSGDAIILDVRLGEVTYYLRGDLTDRRTRPIDEFLRMYEPAPLGGSL